MELSLFELKLKSFVEEHEKVKTQLLNTNNHDEIKTQIKYENSIGIEEIEKLKEEVQMATFTLENKELIFSKGFFFFSFFILN
jgi:hypothetical protein